MKKIFRNRPSIWLCSASAVGLLCSSAGTVHAQTARVAAGSGVDSPALEEVVITGSRIKRTEFDTSQPAVVLDAEFFNDRGFTNINEALDEVPAFGISLNSQGDSDSQSIGLQFANAFNLGTARTLTLINGRRSVTSNAPTTVENAAGAGLQVDLNTIPTALIERVETVFTGGAPIYGSDAIAGTVNLIMRRDFEGFELDVQYGMDENDTKKDYRIRGLWGANLADGRGNVTVNMEYVETGGVRTDQNDVVRRSSAFCQTGGTQFTLNLSRDCNNLFTNPNAGLPILLDDSTRQGRALFTNDFANAVKDGNGNPLIFGLDGSLLTFDQANVGRPLANITRSIGANGFENPLVGDVQVYNALLNPSDRWNVFSLGHYDLNNSVTAFYELSYSKLEATELINQPRFFTDAFGNNQLRPGIHMNIGDNPFVSEQLRDVLVANDYYDPMLVDESGGTVPQYFKLNRSNLDIEGDTPFFRKQEVFRIVLGLQGEFQMLGRDWSWDAAYVYGQSDAQSRQDQIDAERLAFALDAVSDSNGQAVCRVTRDGFPTAFDNPFPGAGRNTAINNCTPFNPIGFNPLTDEQREYLVQPEFRSTTMKQSVYDFNIAGSLMDLPAGPLGFAGGFTRRFESGQFVGDRSARNALSENAPIRNVSGEFDTTEIYGEALIPVISNGKGLPFEIPFIDMLEIEGAIRYVDNNIAGADDTWTVGGRMRLNLPVIGDSLVLRGNVSEAIRSPAVVELFFPQSEIRTFALDPCDARFVDSGPSPAQRRTNCLASLPQGITPDDFNSLIVNSRREAITGGNPDLENERSKAWTLGFVFTPNFVEGLTWSADWTDITIEDAIVNLSATNVMNACLDSSGFPGAAACRSFGRDSLGQVINLRTGFVNAAERRFSALMSTISYDFPASKLPFLDLPGDMNLFGTFFHVNEHEQEVGAGDLTIFTGERGDEEYQYQLNLRYNLNKLMVLAQMRHLGGFLIDAQAAPNLYSDPKVDSMQIFNATVAYRFTDSLRASLVINNIFDNTDNALRAAGSGGNALNFSDPFGRRYQLMLSASF